MWDRTVQTLHGRYRCARFTLPGFEGPPPQSQKALTLAELIARLLRSPTPQASIHWYKNYPYAMTWLRLGGGLGGLAPFAPHCPVLYVYGERKPGSRAVGLPTGHWVMLEQPEAFEAELLGWLGT